MVSYEDQNFHLSDGRNAGYVLKIANAMKTESELDLELKILAHIAHKLPQYPVSRLVLTTGGETMKRVKAQDGTLFLLRIYTYLEGSMWEDSPQCKALRVEVGRFFGKLDLALMDFNHGGALRSNDWDLKEAPIVRQLVEYLSNADQRMLAIFFFDQFNLETAPCLHSLRRQVIHNDGNKGNVLTSLSPKPRVTGLIDFGDVAYTHTVCEPAIAAAYASLDQDDPLVAAIEVVTGYHQILPLTEDEIHVLFSLICTRLTVSMVQSAAAQMARPQNDYAVASEGKAWAVLQKLIGVHPEKAEDRFRVACGFPSIAKWQGKSELLDSHCKLFCPNQSIAYRRQPLNIKRGFRQNLYDQDGRAYLDCVNNVCHVGHAHPQVVRAGARQMALLNSHRCPHDQLVDYAQRLQATLPAELCVITFVSSSREANDLAQRMACTHTDRQQMVILEGSNRDDQSKTDQVHYAPMPDPYRGSFRGTGQEVGPSYAAHVSLALQEAAEQGKGAAAFMVESLQGGSQLVLPEGYLQATYQRARQAGAVCIADEVQVGLGRIGSHFWGFESQNVVPDIVILGESIGAGHPLAAVVTTRAIAVSFNSSMEHYSSLVSSAIGLAVLDVIEAEQLQNNAALVGASLKAGLQELADRHSLIGDVRGLGLFLGVELVLDRHTLEPAAHEASQVVECMESRGILLSTGGPLANVIRIEPPLVFEQKDASLLLENLDAVLYQIGKEMPEARRT